MWLMNEVKSEMYELQKWHKWMKYMNDIIEKDE